jgi:starch-binding outer membrane protein, SusD/RagB family
MKTINTNRIFALLGFVMLIATSCTPDLEVEPRDRVTDASVWTDPINADLFLNDIYYQLPRMNNETQHLDQFTDNSYVGAEWMWGKTTIYPGAVSPTNVPNGPWDMWKWDVRYKSIRKCNIFIENVNASQKLTETYKKGRLAEARFLRALNYHWLWLAYGGVPIITDVLNNQTQGDEIFRERNTDEETFQFITSELAAIAEDLPESWGDKDHGRPTKGAVLTLKGWVELYAASPLRNPSNELSKWATAAATNKAVMELGIYNLLPDFGNIWLPAYNNSTEIIFDYPVSTSLDGGGRREGLYGPAFVNGIQEAWANYAPTQELVDDFAMDNGKTIDDPTSGYDPQDPYKNREKRFYQTILYDGAPWQGDTIWTRVGVGSQNEIDLGSKSDVSNTGYYARKTLDESIKGQDNLNNANGGANYKFFRYAEVLLNYAEAQNEAVGPDASVHDAVNEVRNRSALPDLPAGLSQDEMRKAIHRERRVEFAFEDKRWWDILRWKIANGPDGVLDKPAHGMYIEKVGDTWTYTPVKVVDKVFPDRMYLMPIPQDARDRNTKLTQNPGY